jgi:hypothetical protein
LVDLQTVSILITGISVSVAAIYYVFTLRINMKTQQLALKSQQQSLETRQAQLFMQLYTSFTSYEFKMKWNEIMNVWEWKDFEDFNSKYGLSNPAEFSKFDLVGTFFEGVGVLVKRGLFDVTLVDDLMSGHIVSGWERFEPIIIEYREKMNWPQCLEWWEYIYHEVKSIAEKQHPEIVRKGLARITRKG